MRPSLTPRVSSQALILLVDDNQDGVIARRSVLEELGYRIVTAGCGSDALRIATEHKFDLVITDYRMSPMDGLELISNLRASGFEGPIILLSGFAEKLGLLPESTGANVVIQKSHNEVANLIRHTKRLLSPKKPAGSHTARAKAASRTGTN